MSTSNQFTEDGDRASRGRLPILYLAPWVDIGGADKGTIDWFRWLDRDRFAPSLITTQPSPNRRLGEVYPFAEEVWALPDCMAGPQFPEFIFDFLHTRGVRLLHIMNSRLGYELLPDLASLDRPPAVVVQLHVEEPSRDGFVRYVATRYGNLVDGFSVVSRHLATALEHDYDIPRSKIHVIPLGVDAEQEFNPERVKAFDREHENGTFQILFAGRLTEQKDPLLMVEVAKRVIARHDHVRINVVGDGPLESDVRRRVRELRLEDHVRFHLPTSELAGWLADSDMLLLTSLFEGIPLVAYEALAMRVPVVASALPGNVELMADGGGCLIEHRDDPSAYAEAISALIGDERLRTRVGADGRDRMLESLRVQDMARGHERLYETLLGAERRQPPRKPQPQPRSPARRAPLRFVSRPIAATPLVSIITPCFNHGRYLPNMLEGVADQDYPEIEVIIVDDGSDDPGTVERLAELELEGTARVIRQSRGGPSAARNRAIEAAAGRYILPVDADNVLLPGAVRSLVEQLQGAGERVGFIYPTVQYFGNRDYRFRPPAYNLYALLTRNFADTCSLFDREIFDAGLRFAQDIDLGHEDWDLVLALGARDVVGEPSRQTVMLYRKHGFTRSDMVEYLRLPFSEEIESRHPELFQSPVRVKARWSPALAIIPSRPVDFDAFAEAGLVGALREQGCQDFELIAEYSRDPSDTGFVVRRIPPGLADSVAQRVDEALSISRARYLLVTSSPVELLSDCTVVERVLRAFTVDDQLRAMALSDLGEGSGRFPWALIDTADSAPAAHALAWRRELHGELPGPLVLPRGDEIDGLARLITGRVRQIQWRHFPTTRSSARNDGDGGKDVAVAATARHAIVLERPPPLTALNESAQSEREERMQTEPRLPTMPTGQVRRWESLPVWMPPDTVPLVRLVNDAQAWRPATIAFSPPPGYRIEFRLGSIQQFSPPGTRRLIRRANHYLTAAPGSPRDSEDDEFGYLEEAPLPLFVGIERAVLEDGSETLVATTGDPLRSQARELTFLGFIEGYPNEPHEGPSYTATGRPILVRLIDTARRRHVYGAVIPPVAPEQMNALGAELGGLHLHPDSGSVPLWVDDAGRLSTDGYEFSEPQLSPAQLLRYTIAPLNWRNLGTGLGRLRAVARRALDCLLVVLSRPGVLARRHTPRALRSRGEKKLVGYLQSEPAPGRIEVFAARHRVLADQLLTHHPKDAADMGYVDARSLGYIQAEAPLTGTLRGRGTVPWASRFGLAARTGG